MRTVPPPSPSSGAIRAALEPIGKENATDPLKERRALVSHVVLEWALIEYPGGEIHAVPIGIPKVNGPHNGDARIMAALRVEQSRFEEARFR